MMDSLILAIHVCGGVAGLLSGTAAMSFQKGSSPHGQAGSVFFISMLTMGSTAVYLGNPFGGAIAIYLVPERSHQNRGSLWEGTLPASPLPSV
jgi:hypothetical protein